MPPELEGLDSGFDSASVSPLDSVFDSLFDSLFDSPFDSLFDSPFDSLFDSPFDVRSGASRFRLLSLASSPLTSLPARSR